MQLTANGDTVLHGKSQHDLLDTLSQDLPGVLFQFQLHPDGRSSFPYASAGLFALCGVTPEQAQLSADAVFKVIEADDLGPVLQSLQRSARELSVWNHSFRMRVADRDLRWFMGQARPEKLDDGSVLWGGYLSDVTERKHAELREQHRTQLLQMLADGAGLPDILRASAMHLERNDPRMLCSILLVSADGQHLQHAIAPSLPDFYNDALEGLPIAYGVGSCGTAAFSRQRVVVEDVSQHPWWEPYRALTQRAGLRACWSQPIFSTQGTVLGTFAIYHRTPCTPTAEDITFIEHEVQLVSLAIERSKVESRMQLAASVFLHAREGIVITGADGNIVEVNATFSRITGYTREEALGRNPRFLQSGRQGPEFYREMWRALLQNKHWYGEVWNRRKNGEIYAEMLTVTAVQDAQGETQFYVALFTDITRDKENEHTLERIAHYDVLTGLPNRVLLADRLQQAIEKSQRQNQSLAVVLLDLDGFKSVNDVHGHAAGDQLLIALAQKLRLALRDGDTLARIGGDEFVAVIADLERSQDCQPLLARLLEAASSVVHVELPLTGAQAVSQTPVKIALSVTASLGVTLYPQDGAQAEQLMRHADQAMYLAKQAGKNRYHLFDVVQDAAVKSLQQKMAQMERAIRQSELVLHYQPKVHMRSGAVLGVEALVRWQHPERGLLGPGEFLPLIMETPLIVDLGDWVLRAALAQIARWQHDGLRMRVSVNLSSRQLQQDDFVAHITSIFAEYPGVACASLELEILESSALQDLGRVQNIMQGCQQMGIGFALDDFGTGYSSLTYLKHLPAEVLKIDQSFVRGMVSDASDRAIVEGIVGLATAFRREVVAEGVETAELGAELLHLGCNIGQGYGIARPMPAADLPGWIAQWQPDPSWR